MGMWAKKLLTKTDLVPSFHKKNCIQKNKQFQICPTKPLQPSLWDALKQAHYGGLELCQPVTDQLTSEKFTRATSREVGNYRNFPQVFLEHPFAQTIKSRCLEFKEISVHIYLLKSVDLHIPIHTFIDFKCPVVVSQT